MSTKSRDHTPSRRTTRTNSRYLPDGFIGFKTAAAEELAAAVALMDPFHVVALAGDALDRTRQRVQRETLGHRGHSGDPLYGARRTLRTGAGLLTERQHERLETVFTSDNHVEVEATWSIYQKIVAAYRNPSKSEGKVQLQEVIASLSRGVPATERADQPGTHLQASRS